MTLEPKYRWIAAAAGMIVLSFMVWYFHTIVFYILGAAVMSLIGKPMVLLLERLKFPRWVAAFTTLILLLVVVLGLAGLFIPVVVDKLNFISHFDAAQLNEMLRQPASSFEHWVNATFPMANFSVRDAVSSKLQPMLSSSFVQNTIGSITNFISEIAIAIFSISFIAYFFLKDDKLFGEGVVTLFPKKYELNIIRAMSSSTNLLARYFIGICIESLIKLVVVTLSLYFIGMEFSTSLIIGLITGVLNVIPYIGPIIGAIFAFVIAAVAPPIMDVSLGGLIFQISIVLLVFQLIDNIVLQPYIYSSSVKAHPLEIFLVILMAGYIAGITGMLLAIPAYTVLRVFAKEFWGNFRVVQKLTGKI